MGTVGNGGALSALQCKVLLLGGRQTELSLVHTTFIFTSAPLNKSLSGDKSQGPWPHRLRGWTQQILQA